jgi:hypothetical protein
MAIEIIRRLFGWSIKISLFDYSSLLAFFTIDNYSTLLPSPLQHSIGHIDKYFTKNLDLDPRLPRDVHGDKLAPTGRYFPLGVAFVTHTSILIKLKPGKSRFPMLLI